MTVAPYPLAWPETMPRAKAREKSQFRTALTGALENVRGSLKSFGVDSRIQITDIVISSNVSLGEHRPADPGVAVWFTWDGEQRCIAVDRYLKPEENLQAIHHVLEARRVELRHGTLALVRATFQGFKALPPPKPWWEVLGVAADAGKGAIEAAYRASAARAHPDRGGTHAAMAELTAARDAGLKQVAQ